jgi:hypothetical protein
MTQSKQRYVIHIDGETVFLLHGLEQNLQQVVLAIFHPAARTAHQMMMRLISAISNTCRPVQRNQAHPHKNQGDKLWRLMVGLGRVLFVHLVW